MSLAAFLLPLLLIQPAPPLMLANVPEHVWIEGETPTKADPIFQSGGWGRANILSGEKWQFAAVDAQDVAKKVPVEGASTAYAFKVKTPGKYDVWARLGYEFARSPFRWRVGANEWKTVKPDELTSDLMAIADFAEVAWLKLGTIELTAGAHNLEFNVPRPTKLVNGTAEPERLLFGFDCACIMQEPFTPNGRFRPGQVWNYPLDYEAQKALFEFPAVPANTPTGTRRTLDMGGTWQIARFDENELVDRAGPIISLPTNLDSLKWRGVRVPGDRDAALPDWAYSHRYLYRTKVRVPTDFAGRSFVLRFPNNALISTVFVNGQRVGFSNTPCAAFECDPTSAIKPGAINEIVVGIKDLYYAIAKTERGQSARYLFNYPHERFHNQGGLGPTRFADFPTLFKVRRNGILETPSLVVGGLQYTADVFAMPSVAKKQLALEVTVQNPTVNPVTVEVRNSVRDLDVDGGIASAVARKFTAKSITIAPEKAEVVTLTDPWPAPKLWWPDSPHRYVVETTLVVNGKVIDEKFTPFGFREWGVQGRNFTLNGIPWHFRADLRNNDARPLQSADQAVKEWRKNGQNMTRFWGETPWTGTSQDDTLTYFDRAGIPVRRSGIFDGEVASYALVSDGKPNAALFDNWRAQLAAWVKAERNHPSVFIWSLENEITYINAKNFGWLKDVEPEIKKAVALVQQLDPTRPVMVDGGDALMDQSLSVAGSHYPELDKRDYPDEAYTFDKVSTRHLPPKPQDPWPVPQDKPLFIGESFFANGSPPAGYAEIIGESAFLGRKEAARGVTKFARMLSEGYRWNGVAAFHFWFAEGPDAGHYTAWQPVAVLCREWNTTFAAGTKVVRNLKLFNDTRQTSPITVYWVLQTKNTPDIQALRGKKEFTVPPGRAEEFTITLDMPNVPPGAKVDADLVLSCFRDKKEVFRDVKACRVLGLPTKLDGMPAGVVAVWDPANTITDSLRSLIPFTSVKSLDDITATAKLVVIGPDAVTPALAKDPYWKSLAKSGRKVLIFDQTNPLHNQAIAADLEPTTFTGRIAFPENLSHPAFTGLTADDFFCMSGSHVVYRNAYRKPSRSARSLLQCDAELAATALVEMPVGDGLMLLSQLAIGEKPTDPVARRLTANLLNYAWNYKKAARPTAVAMADDDPRRKLLTASGLKFTRTDDVVTTLDKAEVVVVDATPDNLGKLVAAPDKVKAFTDKGGQLMLWGVTPEALPDFNKLVGFDHVLRPFKLERVTLPVIRDPLLAGLSMRDVALESTEKIYPWAGDRYPVNDTFTHIVDLDDIAPFVTSDKYADGWSKMTNGLTSADSWKFIFYHDQSQAGLRPQWSGQLPQEEEVIGFSVIPNTDYRRITKLRVRFDNRESTAITLTLKPEPGLKQDFTLPGRKCRSITLEPLEWTDGSKPVIGIDNLWLKVRRPPDFAQRVVPLCNIGGLVKYPQGNGGIVLNQLKVTDTEANPANGPKKRTVVATLLSNLGAEFLD